MPTCKMGYCQLCAIESSRGCMHVKSVAAFVSGVAVQRGGVDASEVLCARHLELFTRARAFAKTERERGERERSAN